MFMIRGWGFICLREIDENSLVGSLRRSQIYRLSLSQISDMQEATQLYHSSTFT